MNFQEILKDEPLFRGKQIKAGLFNPAFSSWQDLSFLSMNLREKLSKNIAWISVKEEKLLISKNDKTQKALLRLEDGVLIETVLMSNSRGGFTICVSAQAGCPIGCAFCATGKMGLKRNLEINEIIDQYRFWMYRGHIISNIVFMGMGEPFLNYENVRDAIRDILEHAKIGSNHIVISTVGIIPQLNRLLEDKLWLDVRLAISLHSAMDDTRGKLVPAHNKTFFSDLIEWAKKYQRKFGAKNKHLSIEYVILKNANDSAAEARALVKFLSKIGQIKVNLIEYNKSFSSSQAADYSDVLSFQKIIQSAGFFCAIRKSRGADIQGACGQLSGL